MKRFVLVLVPLALAGCLPAGGSASVWVLATLCSLFLAASAWAGAPMRPKPCEGYEHKTCVDNRIKRKCYPNNVKVNFAYRPYIDCGYNACVPGNDPSQCTPRQPRYSAESTEADCHPSYWRRACINGKPTSACIMRVPTNYTGPPNNPSFHVCKTPTGDTCTTRNAPDACYPTREELGKTACDDGFVFRRMCIQTHVSERCVPVAEAEKPTIPFVTCPDDRCARTKTKCPR